MHVMIILAITAGSSLGKALAKLAQAALDTIVCSADRICGLLRHSSSVDANSSVDTNKRPGRSELGIGLGLAKAD
ncbi:hypothetical protein WJX74_005101 [Apatococcus lobatus]|uniref:Secreted protein n=1 Tax=Apatococcus lobatus TaxID=904363 RepID=A0AAW1SG66_9CHLO